MNNRVKRDDWRFSPSQGAGPRHFPVKSTILINLLLPVPMVSGLSAALRPEVDVPYTSAAFDIDGNATDWTEIKARGKGISFYKGDGHGGTATNYGTTVLGTITDAADCAVSLWLAHDGVFLYVLAEVRDDAYEPFAAKANSNMAYLEDTLHLYIDSSNARKSAIAGTPISTQPGYEQFGYSTDGNIYGENTDFTTTGSAKQPAPKGSSPDGTHWVANCTVTSVTTGGYLYTFEERITLAGF
ncbi:MAG: hypothetical protein ACP5MD_11830 [Verrucomicrobiia bacterium]